MEPYSLQFDPEAFGSPEDWNARAAYVTWNRRQAQQFVPGPFPITPSERLADFYTFFWIAGVTVKAFHSHGALRRRSRWSRAGSGSLGCVQEGCCFNSLGV